MKTIINETLTRLGLSPDEAIGVKITVCDFCGVLIEGHGGLIEYKEDQILLRVKRRKLRVRGKNLKIREITKDEAYIGGTVAAVEVADE